MVNFYLTFFWVINWIDIYCIQTEENPIHRIITPRVMLDLNRNFPVNSKVQMVSFDSDNRPFGNSDKGIVNLNVEDYPNEDVRLSADSAGLVTHLQCLESERIRAKSFRNKMREIESRLSKLSIAELKNEVLDLVDEQNVKKIVLCGRDQDIFQKLKSVIRDVELTGPLR